MRLPLSIIQHVLHTLPNSCLLCGAVSSSTLCADCANDLPTAHGAVCSICATPMPSSAPFCADCLKVLPAFSATHAAMHYVFPIDRLMQRLKFGGGTPTQRLASVDFFARRMLCVAPTTGDLLLPVPLSAERLRERGFNQALELARPLAEAMKLPLDTCSLIREQHTVPQSSLPWRARHRNVRQAFRCYGDFSGKTVIVVDDVMTSGATLNAVAQTLRDCGAAHVINWVAARTVKSGRNAT